MKCHLLASPAKGLHYKLSCLLNTKASAHHDFKNKSSLFIEPTQYFMNAWTFNEDGNRVLKETGAGKEALFFLDIPT